MPLLAVACETEDAAPQDGVAGSAGSLAGTAGASAGTGGVMAGNGGSAAGTTGTAGSQDGAGTSAAGGSAGTAAAGAGAGNANTGGAGASGGAGSGTAGSSAGSAGTQGGSAGAQGGTAGAGTGGEMPVDRDAHFGDWPDGTDPAVVGEELVQVLADEIPEDPRHYKYACAWYGALVVSDILEDGTRIDELVAKYEPHRGTWAELLATEGHVDENVFGIVPLEIALHADGSVYAEEGLALAAHQLENLEEHKRFAIDDMFMITALQMQAYRVSGESRYLEAAAATMSEYLERLQQPEDGLFHHHETFQHKWGRGNGWVAAGMTEVLRELAPGAPHYDAIRAGYAKMMSGLLDHQLTQGAGVGLWNQILDSTDTRNWPETSGSAMFTYALVSGVRNGWLDVATYGPAARAAWLAIAGKINAQGKLEDVSDWAYLPSSHPELAGRYDDDPENYYFERPKLTGDNHGQAPALWSAAALTR